MVDHSSASNRPVLSYADGLAATTADTALLVGRVLLGWLFFISGWGKVAGIAGFAGYLGSLGVPGGEAAAWIVAIIEFLIGAALILGLGTRYAALATIVFVIFATALAHQYWTFPPEQQTAQFNNFLKNLAIIGGALYVFVAGAGRYSVDRVLTK